LHRLLGLRDPHGMVALSEEFRPHHRPVCRCTHRDAVLVRGPGRRLRPVVLAAITPAGVPPESLRTAAPGDKRWHGLAWTCRPTDSPLDGRLAAAARVRGTGALELAAANRGFSNRPYQRAKMSQRAETSDRWGARPYACGKVVK